MSSAWEAFVKRAIEGEPDDPFVDLLRERIASGSQVVRINLEDGPEGPGYRILLSRLRQLSVMQVRHSPSFTRWSLETGTRMASVEEETQRFALVAAERFETVVEELGADVARAIFVERVSALQPARTTSSLANIRAKRLEPGRAQKRAARLMDSFLGSLAGDLSRALYYSEKEAADILDSALDHFALRQFSSRAHPLAAVMRGGAKLRIK